MNDLRVFVYDNVDVVDSRAVAQMVGKKKTGLISVTNKCASILEDAARIAINMAADGKCSEAVALVSDAFELLNAPFLESCVTQLLLRAVEERESDIYTLFKSNYQYILGEKCRIVMVKNDPRHIPDFWVKIGEEHFPVECKLHKFDKKALDQLLRYMRFYQCTRGIAVGEEFACEIPETITFISIDQLRRCEEKK